ncbi:MAG: Hpt domain-containing protein [Desulfovibrio sp.]|jgi:HPt (histidine-containing phosphotransfer) domain-containing protein|nr:Hpt domain-containing protein [Desulfovibrio sp.]
MNKPYLVLDTEAAVERMGDREMYGEIARAFARNMGNALRDLTRALREGDMPAACRFAHSLKGNCDTVGAGNMRQACLRLEQYCREEKADKARSLFEDLRPKLLELREILIAL